MHKATFMQGRIAMAIEPAGPILIKAGENGDFDPTLPSMQFVRTRYGSTEGAGQVYLPGASLKGAVRAQAERICRSLDSAEQQERRRAVRQERTGDPQEPLLPLADNPLGGGRAYSGVDDLEFNSGRMLDSLDLRAVPNKTAVVYRRSAFVSQIFGNTNLAGRVRFQDAYPKPDTVVTEERNGVAIDRVYGSVAVGPFNMEAVVAGTFTTSISFKNLTLAQLGLLGLTLRDLAEERIGIGFGKSRGFGRVRVRFESLELVYPTYELVEETLQPLNGAPGFSSGELAGLGALCGSPAYDGYVLPSPDEDRAPLPDGVKYQPDELMGVRLVAEGDEQVRAIWRACMTPWKRLLGLSGGGAA